MFDYDAQSSREERTRRQGNYPPQGRPPLQEQRITALLSEDHRQHPGLGFRRMKLRSADLVVQLIASSNILDVTGLTPQLGEYAGSTLSGDFVDIPARFGTASEQARMRKSPLSGWSVVKDPKPDQNV